MNDKIIKAIHDNGFKEDIWFDNEWIAIITYERHPELSFHVYPDDENRDYSLVTQLIHCIDYCTKFSNDINGVLKDIIHHLKKDEFSLTKATCIEHEIKDAVSKLRRSLEEVKQWMDGESCKREVSYDLSLKVVVNDKVCTLGDLTESEKEEIRKQCQERMDSLFDEDKVDALSVKGYLMF